MVRLQRMVNTFCCACTLTDTLLLETPAPAAGAGVAAGGARRAPLAVCSGEDREAGKPSTLMLRLLLLLALLPSLLRSVIPSSSGRRFICAR